MIDAGDTQLLSAQRVVRSNCDLCLSGWRHVDRIGICRDIHDRAEMVRGSGYVWNRASCNKSAAVASIDISCGVEAGRHGKPRKGTLCAQRQPDVAVVQ